MLSTYQGFISNENDGLLPHFVIAQISMGLYPFIVFDSSELKQFTPCFLYNLLTIIFQPKINNFFDMEANNIMFKQGWLSIMTYTAASLFGIINIILIINKWYFYKRQR